MRVSLHFSVGLKCLLCMLAASVFSLSAFAQQATGNIKGIISDQQNAVVAGASVVVKNTSTSAERTITTDSDGNYNVAQLQPGNYEITVTAQGFKTSKLPVSLSVGDTITANINLEVGGATETVNVSADTATTINTSDFKIDGVITRQKVDNLPLNGRNFLQLASLEPGVRVSTGNPGDANSLFNVSIGGGRSSLTRLTVDGGNVVDPVTGGAAQNFSVDTVQEFQLSSFNFDLATGVTSVGAVNIISRTGSNEYHGSGFAFYRDNNMAAYPTLNRVASNPDPFFRRLNAGFTLGGPIVKDKLVWFTNLERLNQTTAYSTIHTGVPVLSQFDTVTSSPYRGWLYNLRTDYNINEKNTAFLRYSSDKNKTFAPVGFNVLPSNWRVNKNDVYQAQAGWTSSLRPTLVNELFFNYQQIANRSLLATTSECANCIGLNGPQIRVNNSSFRMGNPDSAPQTRALYRYETTNNLTWTKGKHIFKTGLNWEKAYGRGRWDFVEPGVFVTHDPRDVASINGAIDLLAAGLGLPANDPTGQQLRAIFGPVAPALKLPLPAAFVTPGARITYQDFLGLPIAGFVAGLGDGSQPPAFNSDFARHTQRIRLYGQDTWNMGKGFTLKYGLSWIYENKLWNHDLKKSALFSALYGTADANPRDKNNFAPSVGFAWDVNQNQKTVIRGGFSMAYDTSLYVNRLTERAVLGPLGNGRVVLPNAFYQNTTQFTQLPAQFTGALPTVAQQLTAFANTLPANNPTRAQLLTLAGIVPALGLINIPAGTRLADNVLQTIPTKLTLGQALTTVQQQNQLIQGQFAQLGGAGVIGADFFKTVSTTSVLIDPNIQVPYSLSWSAGLQRELPGNMILSADFVLRNYRHIFFQRDRSLYNSVNGPVIPRCTAAQATNPAARCLNGPFEVLQSGGREDYKALLVKLDKRFAKRYQFTASYALSSLTGYDLNRDLTNIFAFSGPLGGDRRNIFTFSGLVNLPWGINAGLITTYESGAPLTAFLPGTNNSDLNGDGTNNDYLPGVGFNQLNRSVSKDLLRKLVADFNTNFAGKNAPRGGQFPTISIPTNFEFSDSFQSHDLRVSKDIKFGERVSLEIIGEVFNLFNISNRAGFSGLLDSGFGQATSKANPIIGIGGPRIFQFAGRLKF
jgi:hypothetical protein